MNFLKTWLIVATTGLITWGLTLGMVFGIKYLAEGQHWVLLIGGGFLSFTLLASIPLYLMNKK